MAITANEAEKRCYTVKEIQEILGISRPTVYELLKKMNSAGSRLEPSIGFQRKVLMGGWTNCKPEQEQNMVKKTSTSDSLHVIIYVI